MIREWWNKKSYEKRSLIIKSIIWFGGWFGALFLLFYFTILPTITSYLNQASSSEIAELEDWMVGVNQFMVVVLLVTAIVPIVYFKAEERKEGNVTHLIHDCLGIRIPTDREGFIKSVIPSSGVDTIKEAAEEDYILEAEIPMTNWKLKKGLNN